MPSRALSKNFLLAASAIAVLFVAGCAQPEPVAVEAPEVPLCPTGVPESADAPYRVSGNILAGDDALANVPVQIEVGDWAVEVCSGADGRWSVYVPEGDPVTVTLDPASLPSGIVAGEESLTKEVSIGVVGSIVVNYFLSEEGSAEASGTESAVEPGWLVPWVSIDGYTYDLVISASAGELSSDITSAPPGFTDITVPIDGTLTVTNTTPSRNAPASPGLLSLAAIFPGTSPLCQLQSAWKLYIDSPTPGELPDSSSYCGVFSRQVSGVSLSSESEFAVGETRSYDLSGVIAGELPESAIAQATADAAAPIWSGSFHISYTPEDLYRCAAGSNRTVYWTEQPIPGCTDVVLGTPVGG